MARRPTLTDAGLLAESYGSRPYTVTLREEKEAGSNVILDYSLAGGARRKRTLGYAVRRKAKGRWEWDGPALDRAREAAEDRSAELRLHRMRDEVLQAHAITFGEAVELYTDPERGGLPRNRLTATDYLRTLRRMSVHFGASRPWNAIRPNEADAWARKRIEQGKIPTALHELAVLRAMYNWLDAKAGIDGLTDPLRGFDWKKLRDAHQVKRPRFTPDQLRKIVAHRHDVDPRFALLLALMDDSGARSKALRTVMRSAVDCALELPPTPEQAPFGWVVFPALKGQRSPLHLLTAFERRELGIAFAGYLRELEAGWQALGMDYPLFPGARLADRDEKVVEVKRANAFRPAAYTTIRLWLREAEKLAGIEHVNGLAFHGIRRAVSDLMYEELGLDAMTTAMAWSTRSTPEQIYVDRLRMGDRVMAREAMERKRDDDGKP